MHSTKRAIAGMGTPHSSGTITVDEYYEMARVGLIDPDARVELIEGEIVAMAPTGTMHGYGVDVLADRFHEAVRGRAHTRVQGALRLSNRTEQYQQVAEISEPEIVGVPGVTDANVDLTKLTDP